MAYHGLRQCEAMWSDVKRREMGCSTSRVAWWRFQVILIRTYRGKWQFGQPHGHGVLRPGVPGVPGLQSRKGRATLRKTLQDITETSRPKLGRRLRSFWVWNVWNVSNGSFVSDSPWFTVIHQVVSSGNEFSGSQRAGIWHLDLQRSVPRGAQDSTGRHRTAPAPVVLESRICRWHPQEWKWPVRMAGGWILVWGGRGAKVCWHWAHAVGHIILGSGTWSVTADLLNVGSCWQLLRTIGNSWKLFQVLTRWQQPVTGFCFRGLQASLWLRIGSWMVSMAWVNWALVQLRAIA